MTHKSYEKKSDNRFDSVRLSADAPEEKDSTETTKDTCKVFDAEELLASVAQNKALMNQVINVYLDTLPQLMQQITVAIADNDAKSLEFHAHSLKGMSFNIHAAEVAQAAMELENMAYTGDLSCAQQAYDVLEKRIEALKSVLAIED